jgi:hypothetical protein
MASIPDDPGSQPLSDASREQHPHRCQHAYTGLRTRILVTQSRLSSDIQPLARAVFLILDVPARWLMDISDTLIGNRGYIAIGSVVAVYFAVFGLIDAKATQEETRASVERSLFVTLVSSGNVASFVAAMKDFGPTQAMPVTEHPSLFKFWEWGRTYQPNREPMWHWAVARLGLCKGDVKDCSLSDGTRLDLSGADLDGAKLRNVDLRGANMNSASLREADLHNADLSGAHLEGAKLNGADLSDAALPEAQLNLACGIPARLPFFLHSPKPCP